MEDVPGRRIRGLAVEQGVDECDGRPGDEEQLAERDEVPGAGRGGLVQAHTDDDRGDRREAHAQGPDLVRRPAPGQGEIAGRQERADQRVRAEGTSSHVAPVSVFSGGCLNRESS